MSIRVEVAIARLNRTATNVDNLPPARAATIQSHIDYLNQTAPAALASLADIAPTGYSSGSNIDSGGYSGRGDLTSVEAAVANRTGTPRGPSLDHAGGGSATAVDRLERHILTAANHLALACTDTVRANQHAHADIVCAELCSAIRIVNDWHTIEWRLKQRLTCNCGTLDGWMEWGDPDCGQIAATNTNGLCTGTRPDGTPGCHQRREAWRQRQLRARRRVDPRSRRIVSST